MLIFRLCILCRFVYVQPSAFPVSCMSVLPLLGFVVLNIKPEDRLERTVSDMT